MTQLCAHLDVRVVSSAALVKPPKEPEAVFRPHPPTLTSSLRNSRGTYWAPEVACRHAWPLQAGREAWAAFASDGPPSMRDLREMPWGGKAGFAHCDCEPPC